MCDHSTTEPIYGIASCHYDTSVHIAEFVMSQKMAAFVLAPMEKVSWRVCAVYLLILPKDILYIVMKQASIWILVGQIAT